MHETHIIQPIIKGIAEHARQEGARRVSKVRVKLGSLTGLKEDSFKETFAVLAKGTTLENTQIEITSFPGSRVEVISFDID